MLFFPATVYFFGISNEKVICLYIDLYIAFRHVESSF